MSARLRFNALFLIGSLGALLVWAPLMALGPIEDGNWSPELLICAFLLVYSACRLSVIAALGEPKLLTMTFFVFIYVWIGIAGSAQLYAGQFPWRVANSPDSFLPALLVVALAVAAYELGVLFVRIRPPASTRRTWFEGMNFAISDRAAIWLSIVSVGCALIGIAIWGPNHLFITRAQAEVVPKLLGLSKPLELISKTLMRVPSLVAFVVVVYNALTRWKTLDRERKRFYFVLGSLLALLNIATNYPPAQARHWLGVVLLAPAFALVRWRRWLASFWIVAMSIGLIVVFPYSDLFRHANTLDEAMDAVRESAPVTQQLLTKGDYDVFQMTVNGYQYTQDFGVAWGENILGAVAFWVPRSIWPDKPEGTGYTVAKAYHYDFLLLSAPLWMEFDYAFGWLGVGVLMFLYGWLSGWSERFYEASVASGTPHSLARTLVPYWAGFQIFILRGDLLNVIAFTSFGLGMLLVTAAMSRPAKVVQVPTLHGFSRRA